MQPPPSPRVPDRLAPFLLTVGYYAFWQLHEGQRERSAAATVRRRPNLVLVGGKPPEHSPESA